MKFAFALGVLSVTAVSGNAIQSRGGDGYGGGDGGGWPDHGVKTNVTDCTTTNITENPVTTTKTEGGHTKVETFTTTSGITKGIQSTDTVNVTGPATTVATTEVDLITKTIPCLFTVISNISGIPSPSPATPR
ncbi:hypothetical protein V491_05559 [Pseudogymnoascus sp. VKM F-3775]|nr:hypothetical protein V491_05559 [Pseudogymnoascus sp. VKM F-3775]